MENYNELKASIEQQIRSNGNQEITGDILQGILLGILDYAAGGYEESDVMYGVEWDVTNPDPAMTRIGNMTLHRQLPIQNRMKGCLLNDDGEVVEYLSPTNWNAHALDGSRGQVMVELPEHYRKFETDGNIRRCKMSEYPLPGFHRVKKMYISAYEATVQRSSNKLASVKSMSEDYRGGSNNEEWDDTYRSLLGCPATLKTRSQFRLCAKNRGTVSGWAALDYNVYKSVVWLYYVEFANKNCQDDYSNKRGLGSGVTTISVSKWNSHNGYNPFVKCGTSDDFGNFTGVKEVAISGETDTFAVVEVPRYRGVENLFGHIQKWVDGANVVIEGGVAKLFVAKNTDEYNDESVGYEQMGGVSVDTGCVIDLMLGEYGEILPIKTSTIAQSWMDWAYMPSLAEASVRSLLVGGSSKDFDEAGLLAVRLTDALNSSFYTNGTRLCFIPQNS